MQFNAYHHSGDTLNISVFEINSETEAAWAAAWRDHDAMFDANESGVREIVQHVVNAEASK